MTIGTADLETGCRVVDGLHGAYGLVVRLYPEEPVAGPWRVERIDALIARVVGSSTVDRAAVIAIDGRSSNGKTSVSERIRAVVPDTAVVHTDDIAWHHSILGWADLLVDGVLRPVRAGHSVSYRPPAWDLRGRQGAIEVASGTRLLVVEGVGASRREVTPFLDASIWVQSDLDVTLARDQVRVASGEASPGLYETWMAEEVPFQAEERPWERATVIVNGTPLMPYDPEIEVVIADPM
jgi:hypothetical protein